MKRGRGRGEKKLAPGPLRDPRASQCPLPDGLACKCGRSLLGGDERPLSGRCRNTIALRGRCGVRRIIGCCSWLWRSARCCGCQVLLITLWFVPHWCCFLFFVRRQVVLDRGPWSAILCLACFPGGPASLYCHVWQNCLLRVAQSESEEGLGETKKTQGVGYPLGRNVAIRDLRRGPAQASGIGNRCGSLAAAGSRDCAR